jgi:hypothetical protein
MKGQTAIYSWANGPPSKKMEKPDNPNIQVVNLKSNWKPFQIVSPVNSSLKAYTGEVTYSMFEWWNHWPVAQVRSSGISAVAPDRPSHSSLSHILWDPYATTENSMTKILLHGLTTKSAADLVPLAKSWLSAPGIEVSGEGFESHGYDQTQRAFVIVRQNAATAPQLRLSLQASSESPLLNPAFQIKNWGDREPKLRLDGKPAARGANVRYGFVPTLEGTDLVVWLRMEATKPTRVEIAAGK